MNNNQFTQRNTLGNLSSNLQAQAVNNILFQNLDGTTSRVSFHDMSHKEKLSVMDIVALNTLMCRQYYVLKDLYNLYDKYPNAIDADIVSSLDSLFRAMNDMTESLEHYNR